MKKTLMALGILGLLLVAPRAHGDDVSVDFFYNNLSGGSWMEVGDYGYCWQPYVAVGNASWRPYADGYWAYTDLGWTWVSYEDFGWATYHYGRWAMLNDYGWVWVPGRDADLEWGPAWVSWRAGGEYVGWAPLPPETISVVESRPLTGHLDVEFNIGPAYYNFVDVRYIGEPVLRERIIAPAQNVTYIQQTVNVTNITYKNKTVYNYGPDINVINRTSARPIQRLRLDREQNVDFATAAKSGGLTKVQGDRLMVAAPMHINRLARQVAPPAVKAKVESAKIDRGWSSVGDEKAQAQFKERIKGQDLKNVPPISAAGAAASQTNAAAGASPAAGPVTGAQPTDANQGRDRGRRGAAAMMATSPNPEASPTGPSSPAENTGAAVAGGGPGEVQSQPQQNRVQQGQHAREFQNRQVNPAGQNPGSVHGAADQRQGQVPQERRFQNQSTGNPQAEGQGEGRVERQQHSHGQDMGQDQGGGHGQGQSQDQNHHGGKKEEASPAATPR